MIRYLHVRHLAVIDAVDLELGRGFTVLTGETGAGKSLVVEAVALLLGARASAELVRSGATAATVQAIVETPGGAEMIVRREITAAGKSRAFIDDALVTTGRLREVMGDLVDLHGQHDQQGLLQAGVQLAMLDEFGGLHEEVNAVRVAWHTYGKTRETLEQTALDERERTARLELIALHLDEIDRAAPVPGEDDELAAERQVLAHADRIQGLCRAAYDRLYESETSVLDGLGQVWRQLEELSGLDARFAPYLDMRAALGAEVEDLALFLRDAGARLENSPARLQAVEDRLAALERLKRRHGPTLAAVIARRAELVEDRERLQHTSERAAVLEADLAEARDHYVRTATALATRRRQAAPELSATLRQNLAELALPHAQIDLRFSGDIGQETSWGPRGIDAVEILLSANPGEPPKPLARIASGGELSRVALAAKTATPIDGPGKTLVFDEVDAGIGGRVADAVGARLAALGDRCQVLCITHLAQVAAKAGCHLIVEKGLSKNHSVTTIRSVSGETRVDEIARMIGGTKITPQIRSGARDLLAARSEGRPARARR